MHDATDDPADPEPQPPAKPAAAECCESGCERCVFDVYAEEMERYRAALAEWRERRDEAATRRLPPSSS